MLIGSGATGASLAALVSVGRPTAHDGVGAGARTWLAGYAVASYVYRWAVLLGTLGALYAWLEPRKLGPVVYVVPQGSCTLDQFNARTCTFLVRSDSGSKPRKVSGSNVAAGTYDLLVANFSSQDESASALVVLSSSSCPSVASVGASRDTGQVVGRTAVFR